MFQSKPLCRKGFARFETLKHLFLLSSEIERLEKLERYIKPLILSNSSDSGVYTRAPARETAHLEK